MFHTILTLTYLIPNIYVYFRIRSLFIGKNHRLAYTLIFIVLASIYPLSNILSEDAAGILSSVVSTVAGYLLPFYLYLFLLLLLLDIFLLFNAVFKIVRKDRLKSVKFRTSGIVSIILISTLIVVAGVINFRTIRVTGYNITVPGRSSDLKNLKIAFVSDFHLQGKTDTDFVRKFAGKIAEINPDIMLFGGDIVEGDRDDDGNMETHAKIISGIRTRYGSFTVPGNHEHYGGQVNGDFFGKAGIRVLIDTLIVINRSFILGGRNDAHSRTRISVAELMKNAGDSLPVILIDHRPTELDQVSKTSVDVQLSGHTHHGQLIPINLITEREYELSYGHMKKRNTHFLVSSGIRLWGPPVRTIGKSEIMVINIAFDYNK
ncbi:MAG: metallophosphoesterase [Bacteroidales bacterium]